MQTFNLSTVSNDDLDKLASKILELKRVSFPCVEKVLKQMDENYPLVIPNWLLIIIAGLGTTVLIIIVSTVGNFKYCKATGMVKHFLTRFRWKNKTPLPATNQLLMLNG